MCAAPSLRTTLKSRPDGIPIPAAEFRDWPCGEWAKSPAASGDFDRPSLGSRRRIRRPRDSDAPAKAITNELEMDGRAPEDRNRMIEANNNRILTTASSKPLHLEPRSMERGMVRQTFSRG